MAALSPPPRHDAIVKCDRLRRNGVDIRRSIVLVHNGRRSGRGRSVLARKKCLEATLPELKIRLRLAFKLGQNIFDVGHGGYDWTRKLSNLDRYLTKFAQIWQKLLKVETKFEIQSNPF
jgi:hypothetical protein